MMIWQALYSKPTLTLEYLKSISIINHTFRHNEEPFQYTGRWLKYQHHDEEDDVGISNQDVYKSAEELYEIAKQHFRAQKHTRNYDETIHGEIMPVGKWGLGPVNTDEQTKKTKTMITKQTQALICNHPKRKNTEKAHATSISAKTYQKGRFAPVRKAKIR